MGPLFCGALVTEPLKNIEAEQGWFHCREGWYFRRVQDGIVQIGRDVRSKSEQLEGAPLAVKIHLSIDPSSWTSIIAHVARPGQVTSDVYHLANEIHI